MQRIKLLTIVSLLLVFAVPQTTKAQEQQQLVVWLTNGQKIYHDLSDEPETMFSDGQLWLKTAKVTASYPLTEVLRYTFEGPMTAIETPLVSSGELRFMQSKDAMAFEGLTEGTILELYSLDGKKLSSVKARSGQQTLISLANRPSGTYIVKMGDASFKFVKP